MISATSPAVDLLTRYLRALERMDLNAAMALLAETVVIKVPCMPEPSAKEMVGRAAVEPVMKWVFANIFKQFTWTELEVHACDDPNLAFAMAKSSIVLSDGRHYSNDYLIYARVQDGMIVEETEFFDTTRAAQAFEGLV